MIKTNELIRGYYNLFYKFDVNELSALADKFREVRSEIEAKISGEDAVLLSHLNHIAIKVADFSASTFALNN